MDRLIRDDDTAVYGDKGDASDAKKRAAEAAGVLWAVEEKAKRGGRLTARQRARNHSFGKVRAKAEHAFRVVNGMDRPRSTSPSTALEPARPRSGGTSGLRGRVREVAEELTRSYQGPDTETQTYCLRTITFGLQRAARQFGYRKVRYRGIATNGAQVLSLLGLANLYLARRTFASA